MTPLQEALTLSGIAITVIAIIAACIWRKMRDYEAEDSAYTYPPPVEPEIPPGTWGHEPGPSSGRRG